MIAIDLRKQQTLDVNPKATQQINFTGNLDRARNEIVEPPEKCSANHLQEFDFFFPLILALVWQT